MAEDNNTNPEQPKSELPPEIVDAVNLREWLMLRYQPFLPKCIVLLEVTQTPDNSINYNVLSVSRTLRGMQLTQDAAAAGLDFEEEIPNHEISQKMEYAR